MLDIGSIIDNFSTLIGIDLAIIPTCITLFVILILIYLTFKMNLSGLLSIGILIALYTISMALLAFLNINSALNMFSLFDGTLALVVSYGN